MEAEDRAFAEWVSGYLYEGYRQWLDIVLAEGQEPPPAFRRRKPEIRPVAELATPYLSHPLPGGSR